MLIRLISLGIQGFDHNLMKNCPIKTIKVYIHMLSGSRKPNMIILVSK